MLQKEGPIPGPESGLFSNIQKWIVQGNTCADKARDFIGKGLQNYSATWLTVPGFMLLVLSCFSRVQLFAILWAIACQLPLSMRFSRQEYRSGLLCPPPGDLPDPGIEPMSLKSPAMACGFFLPLALMVIELISRLSLASHLAWPICGLTQGPSWWGSYLSPKMDSSKKSPGILAGQYCGGASPPSFWPLQNFPHVRFWGAALCSWLGPPVVRQLMQAVIIMPDQDMWFWSMIP